MLNPHTNISFPGGAADGVGVLDDGTVYSNDVAVPSINLGAFTAPMTVVGMAVGGGNVWFRLNGGNWNGSPTAKPGGNDTGAIDLGVGGIPVPAGAQHFMASVSYSADASGPQGYDPSSSITVNSTGPFVYTPPIGFAPWFTLPDSFFYNRPYLRPVHVTAPPVVPGWEVVRKGYLNNNQSTFDVEVPDGYSSFQFRLVGAHFSSTEYFCFEVSCDNGASFLNDGVNYDTYSQAEIAIYNPDPAAPTFVSTTTQPAVYQKYFFAAAWNAWDQVAYLSANMDSFDWYMDFYPGDDTQYFRGQMRLSTNTMGQGTGNSSGGYGWTSGSVMLNPTATVPITKKRVNYIRFGGYRILGTGGSAGHVPIPFSSGTWYLMGLKA
jgi:hypothetical protein